MKPSLRLSALILLALLIAPLSAAAQTTGPVQPVATAATAAGKTITVKVALESGKAGEQLPADAKMGAARLQNARLQNAAVTLYAMAGQSPAYTREAKTDAAGTAEFTAVPYQDGLGFGVVARVGLTTYISDLTTPAAGAAEVSVPVKVYATTSDTSKLRVSQAFVLAEVQGDDRLSVTNLYVLSNDGDRTVEGGLKDAEGKAATLTFPLPSGAQDVKFEEDDGTGIALAKGGFLSRPGVQPGQDKGRVLVRYSLPYSDSLRFESKLAYPADKLTVFVATQGITVTGSLMKSLGTQQRADGVTMNIWGAEKLAANQAISYELSGKPAEVPPLLPASATKAASAPGLKGLAADRSLEQLAGMGLIGLGLMLAVIAAGWWLYRARFAPNPTEHQVRALLGALADLQEDREAGRIEPEDYEQRRLLLTAALASLVAPAPAQGLLPEPEAA